MTREKGVDSAAVVAHVLALLTNPRVPPLSPELAEVPDLQYVHDYLLEMRRQLGGYSKGDFTADIKMRGVLAGMIKSLQANMRHLIWQMERVEAGDLNQRVDFMGDFSSAFNKMVQRLNSALTALRQKEQELVTMTHELEREVEKRGAAMAALQKSQESFKYLAEHDPLTGLLNRRSFFARAEVELARNAIMGHPCTIALMDVDHFKAFNDTHGHLNGDIALRHTAEHGASTLRDSDIMGRYGGEEFIFLFTKAGIEQGFLAAERIRKNIESNPVELGNNAIYITASFGVTSIPPGITADSSVNTLEFAVGMADAALYRAKSQGRNQVCIETLPEFPSRQCQLPRAMDDEPVIQAGDKTGS